jgi:hypothetical protein
MLARPEGVVTMPHRRAGCDLPQFLNPRYHFERDWIIAVALRRSEITWRVEKGQGVSQNVQVWVTSVLGAEGAPAMLLSW